MTEAKRKGARSIREIPGNTLEQLNRGEIETANLVEYLGIDRKALIENVLNQHGRKEYLQPIFKKIESLEKRTANTVHVAIGAGLVEQAAICQDHDLLLILSAHPSDIVRCWATYLIGNNAALNIEQMLQNIRPFAADRHFNVRECAWADVRKKLVRHLSESLTILSVWAMDEDENIRRFASEATRPRGVWCEHIIELRQHPERGLPILEPLKSDPSKYVRDSVGNWLNDASKTRPDFVKELCLSWEKESDTKETKYIINKALRTIRKSLSGPS